MSNRCLILICFAIVSARANSMSGTFQSCSLQCSESNDQFAPTRPGKILRGKQGPRGDTGIKGNVGPKGDAGQSFDVKEFRDLQEKVTKLEEDKLKLEKKLEDQISQYKMTYMEDCNEIKKLHPNSTSDVYTIYTDLVSMEVFCEFEDDGSAWMVFQRRIDGSTDFNKNFLEFSVGFGNLQTEFWWGLEKLSKITKDGHWELQVDLEDFQGNTGYARYGSFKIGEGPFFILTAASYSGTAGDSLSYHSGKKFSTPDNDQDSWPRNCAEVFTGSWWHGSCHRSNLNSFTYGNKDGTSGLNWAEFHNNRISFKSTTMKIKKVSN